MMDAALCKIYHNGEGGERQDKNSKVNTTLTGQMLAAVRLLLPNNHNFAPRYPL
jgi:hypothetical protein